MPLLVGIGYEHDARIVADERAHQDTCREHQDRYRGYDRCSEVYKLHIPLLSAPGNIRELLYRSHIFEIFDISLSLNRID